MHKLLLILILFGQALAHAQVNTRDSSIRIVAISAEWGIQVPAADLAKRFGFGGVAGGVFGIKTKSNWTIAASGQFIYGKRVKENFILSGITTKSGYILNNEAQPVQVNLLERGFCAGLNFGRLFPIVGPNPNSGLHASIGAGLMQHHILIQNNFTNVPQLSKSYKKGYDRLTNGIYASQSLGYQHFSNYTLVNYYVGLQIFEGFTANRRTVNYDTGLHDGRARLDIIATLTLKWFIPLYKKKPKDFYFY